MEKKLILITGMFTSGKSTIANNIIRDNEDVFIVPQAVLRDRREDDDTNFFRYFTSKDDYANQDFFSTFGNYGILNKDISSFFNSNKKIGLSVVSTPDINVFVDKIDQKKLLLILKTLGLSIDEEIKLIYERFPMFFEGKTLEDRINLAISLAKEFYYEEEYRSKFNYVIPLFSNKDIIVDNDIIININDRSKVRCRIH